jgi:signal transduction histidine kinase
LQLEPGTLDVDTGSLSIYADPLIEKVFFNLVENAIRHGDGTDRIRFFCLARPGGVVLVCEDDGPGVLPQFKEAIFNRQYFKHTGFGLFLSREILEITGIRISENGEYGKGARFEIFIPEEFCCTGSPSS